MRFLSVEGVTGQEKAIGEALCLIAMVGFAARPFWKSLKVEAASAPLRERTKRLVDKNSRLKPAWMIALQDDVLSVPEAIVIVEAAGEKVDPEE